MDAHRWLAGWYATRLHAVVEKTLIGCDDTLLAICGQWVYTKPRTKWAQKKLDEGVPHCKRCEKLVAERLKEEQ